MTSLRILPVLLAGGSGTRLWPQSREQYPKQFLSLVDERSLLQNTALRAALVPGALPSIFTGLRLGHSFAWILIVVGEMTGVPTGLGSVIMDGRTLSRADLVITGMIIIGVAGFLCDRLIVQLNNTVLRWSPQHRG